jgi:hypothetical protein
MNAVTKSIPSQAIGQAPIVPGSRWTRIAAPSPFGPKRKPLVATILDYRDGWVRYSMGAGAFDDERAPEATFRQDWEHAQLEVTAADDDSYRPAFQRFAAAKGYPRDCEPDWDGFYKPHDLHTLWVGFLAGAQGLYQ